MNSEKWTHAYCCLQYAATSSPLLRTFSLGLTDAPLGFPPCRALTRAGGEPGEMSPPIRLTEWSTNLGFPLVSKRCLTSEQTLSSSPNKQLRLRRTRR